MLNNLVTYRPPPPNRIAACEHDVEHHLSEGAVMLAFAFHLLRTVQGLKKVSIHPDGEHGNRFDFKGWLAANGLGLAQPSGRTPYGGRYEHSDGRQIVVHPASGLGDVVAEWEGGSIVAECKGGVLNTRHPGQQSRLRQGLCETVGLSLASPIVPGRKQFAVVPRTRATEALARRMSVRTAHAGVSIALVDGSGRVESML
ncbi:MAG: hypothetical protein K8F62_14220 [Pseudorhodoplanes sp.]|nr:hypothetical protein [Pseudorhodoplanes sp.]